jgi:hypothetical protein
VSFVVFVLVDLGVVSISELSWMNWGESWEVRRSARQTDESLHIHKIRRERCHRQVIYLVFTSSRMYLPSGLALSECSKSRSHLLRGWNNFALIILRFDRCCSWQVECLKAWACLFVTTWHVWLPGVRFRSFGVLITMISCL